MMQSFDALTWFKNEGQGSFYEQKQESARIYFDRNGYRHNDLKYSVGGFRAILLRYAEERAF